MMNELKRAIKVTVFLMVILCGVYPAAVWVVGNVLFHDRATGGLIYRDGKAVGAQLIGQSFSQPQYFHGRPSAAGNGYDAANSSGSNLGPTNQKLIDRMKGDVDAFLKANPSVHAGEIPVDLVTASGSGLDPHVSEAGALVQVARIAAARKISEDQVRNLIAQVKVGRQWGLFGEPTVNVLQLNLRLDEMAQGK